MGLTMDDAVPASLAQAVGATATAAVQGAARAAATAVVAPAGSISTVSPEALQGAVAAAMQPVVEQLKDLVRVVQIEAEELRAAVAASAVQQYKATAAAHNICALIEKNDSVWLMPVKNTSGKVPQGFALTAGLIKSPRWQTRTGGAAELNATLERLLRFYGVDSGPIADEHSLTWAELESRAQMLRQVLCRA
ncbi:hypothetical protein ABPG77_006708 [Micractinium sp. CCAP 211/92]